MESNSGYKPITGQPYCVIHQRFDPLKRQIPLIQSSNIINNQYQYKYRPYSTNNIQTTILNNQNF